MNRYTHMCTHAHFCCMCTAFLSINSICQWASQQDECVFLTGISPHSGAGVKVPATMSTLDLKVWTRLEENDFFKREEKNLRGNPLQSSFIKWISQKRVFGCPDLLSFWFLPTRRVKLAWLVEYSTLNMIARAGSVPERWASVEGGSLCCGWLGCEDWASAQCLILTALWMILGQTLH